MGHREGDDLKMAQGFVDQTTNMLRGYFDQPALPAAEELIGAMGDVQRGAKRLRARAIYQSAQGVISCLDTVPVSESAIAGRLLALNKLVTQYAGGLAEIQAPEAIKAEALSTPDVMNVEMTTPANDPANDYEAAKQTLSELLPHATQAEATSLTRLMTLEERKQPIIREIELESLMRDIVQDALSIARISGKTISISYDMGQTFVREDFQATLQVRLSRALRALILETLPREGTGHMDITATMEEVCIKAGGPAPQFMPDGVRAEEASGITRIYLAVNGDQAALPDEHSMPDAPKRMITDETEETLRAQLSELMEPGTVLAEVRP